MSDHITAEQLKAHNKPNDCWIAIEKKVYNVTKFLKKHPGGYEVLFQNAGQDATISFATAHNMNQQTVTKELKKMLVGVLMTGDKNSCPFTIMAKAGEIKASQKKLSQLKTKRIAEDDKSGVGKISKQGTVKKVGFHGPSLEAGASDMEAMFNTNKKDAVNSKYSQYLDEILSFMKSSNRLDTFSFFFYQYIFRQAKDLASLFQSALSKLAVKFGKLFSQLMGTASLDDHGLQLFLAQLSLRHLQYGVTSAHVDPFGVSLLTCVKTFCKKHAFNWKVEHQSAWKWLWKRVAKSFKKNLDTVGPHVTNINSSWTRLCYQASIALQASDKKRW